MFATIVSLGNKRPEKNIKIITKKKIITTAFKEEI